MKEEYITENKIGVESVIVDCCQIIELLTHLLNYYPLSMIFKFF